MILQGLKNRAALKDSQGYFKAGLKLMLEIVQPRLHTTFGICDKLLLDRRHRCQTLGNSIDIGSISHLNGSNNCLNYLRSR